MTEPISRDENRRSDKLNYHLERAHVPFESHEKGKMTALAEQHASRKKIYLDTNFWLHLRDADTNRSTNGAALLQALRHGVRNGDMICPLSDSIFMELLRQSDKETLLATAKLMDELSLGFCLADEHSRMATEVAHLFHENLSDSAMWKIDEIVWTKVAFAFGRMMRPVDDRVPGNVMAAIHKSMFDEMWEASLEDILEKISESSTDLHDGLDGIALYLNEQNAIHASSIKSFKQCYRSEAAGVASLFADTIQSIFLSIGIRAGFISPGQNYNTDAEIIGKTMHLIALALEKPKGRRTLRTLHCLAALHASNRWDKGRKLDSHDLLDFSHAASALSYCDAFFTEAPLRTMIEQRHIALALKYNVNMASSVTGAVEVLKSLGDA